MTAPDWKAMGDPLNDRLPPRRRQVSPHDECPTCGGCIDAPLVGPHRWHWPAADCIPNICTPCRDECHAGVKPTSTKRPLAVASDNDQTERES